MLKEEQEAWRGDRGGGQRRPALPQGMLSFRGGGLLSVPVPPALRKLRPDSSGRCYVYRVIGELSTVTSCVPWESWLRGHYVVPTQVNSCCNLLLSLPLLGS